MDRKMRTIWAAVSVVWILFMLNLSFQDLKYGLRYHLFHSRVEAEHQARLAEYEQSVKDEEESIRKMLQAAKRYDELEFLALAPRSAHYRAGNQPQEGSPRAEMAALEQTYGKSTLRKYREQNAGTEQILLDEMHARLLVPQMREPRLAAVLFNLFALPLAMLLLLWIYEQGYRRIVKYRL